MLPAAALLKGISARPRPQAWKSARVATLLAIGPTPMPKGNSPAGVTGSRSAKGS